MAGFGGKQLGKVAKRFGCPRRRPTWSRRARTSQTAAYPFAAAVRPDLHALLNEAVRRVRAEEVRAGGGTQRRTQHSRFDKLIFKFSDLDPDIYEIALFTRALDAQNEIVMLWNSK